MEFQSVILGLPSLTETHL